MDCSVKLSQNHAVAHLRYQLVTFMSVRPNSYYLLRRVANKNTNLCVSHQTEMVIEGFPRSANSTTVGEFMQRQVRPVQVAHHRHHAAQLLRAVEWNLPAIMLIRDPLEAVVSLLALQAENLKRTGQHPRWPVTAADALQGWVTFYSAMAGHCEKIVVAPFLEVTRSVSPFIREVNSRFGTDFVEDDPKFEKVETGGWHALPNPIRDALTLDLRENINQQLKQSYKMRNSLHKAQEIHQSILAHG